MNEIDVVYGVMGEMRGRGRGDPMERDHFEDLGFDGRIML